MSCSAAPSSRLSGPGRVLVVDDDRRAASQTAQWLCGRGWHARAVGRADEALPLLAREPYAAVIVDGLLPEAGAMQIADALRLSSAATALVVAVPSATSAAADAALGPDAVVHTPARDDELLAALATAVGAAAARHRGDAAPRLLGASPAIRRVLDAATRLADAPATLLITGESGTGKSLLAREIHRTSRRRDSAFVEVACGCLSETLLESELFGHVAGAFTGATADRAGKFMQADRGTIFLDEIATASPALQVKLLRVLQDRRFEAVGSTRTHSVDARVILATHEDLAALVAAGRFRGDLFWRVNVITIEMPPLRERQEDIAQLARHFLTLVAARGGRRVAGFSPESIDVLSRHRWPGNVRELEHAVEHAALLGNGERIEVVDLPVTVRKGAIAPCAAGAPGAGSGVPASPLKLSLADPERRLILDALERHGWRRGDAARALGINRTTLYKKLKRLGMSLAELTPASR